MPNWAIQTRDLTKEYVSDFLRKRRKVVDGLNLVVQSGSAFGLIGPNGAGKTTTLKLLIGLLRGDSGEITVLGYKPGHEDALARIGFLPESPHFYSHLTGLESLRFVGRLFGLKGSELEDRSRELLEMVSLADSANLASMKYSKGMLQRLGIAQSLINNPDLVLLDEPMSGLDPLGRRDLRRVLNNLRKQGKTIFFNSHLLPDVTDICDRVGVMNKGKLVAEESIDTFAGGHRDLEEFFLETVGCGGSIRDSETDQNGSNH